MYDLPQSTTSPAEQKLVVDCQLCSAQISRNMSCLIAHAKVHLAYKPLKCDYCSFRHFAMSKIRRHNNRVHPQKPVKVRHRNFHTTLRNSLSGVLSPCA